MQISRREFLRWLYASGATLALARCAPQPAPQPALTAPAATPTIFAQQGSGAFTAPPPTRLTAPPEPGRITPTEQFYVVRYSDTIPVVDINLWGMQVAGLVERTLTLKWADILARPQVNTMRTLECISNPAGGGLIGNATWHGVSLRDLLNEAGIKSGAKFVTFEAQDDYLTTVALERALDPNAFLVHSINGAPLTREHGFPLRVLIPGVYGQKQPKWISRIVLTDQNEKGFWEQKGWSNDATVQLNARIELPEDEAKIQRGAQTLIAGMAFANLAGVRRVEISTDAGAAWREATLVPAPMPYAKLAWMGWYTEWTPTQTGRAIIQARATDGAGNSQAANEQAGLLSGVFPNGSAAIHQVAVTVE